MNSASGPRHVDTDEAHSARVYDYILGGKDHYAVDKEAGDAMVAEWPALPVHMRENRAFMHRAGRYLARDAGIRQFIDIGTGLPTSPNLHEVVQGAAPESRVLYVDNDPLVLTHARALLTSSPEGRTAYIDADMRDPDAILADPAVEATVDLTEPVGLMVIGILHFILSGDGDHDLVRRLMEPLPPGSYLAATIGTADFAPAQVGRVAQEYERRGMPMQLRTHAEASAFFEGMDLVDPGVVQAHRWNPDPGAPPVAVEDDAMYGGLARKR